MNIPPAATSPWFRQPLVWMIIAIPLSSVIMGVVIISLSVSSFDGLVADDYYKRGLQINRVLDRDVAATRAGLSAQLDLGSGATRLDLVATAAGFPAPATVTLDLSYSTRAGLDRSVQLVRTPDGFYAGPMLEALTPGRWYVQVAAGDWRLTGSLVAPGGANVSMTAAGVGTR